jgi:uncharacterized protein (UPF0303 family)
MKLKLIKTNTIRAHDCLNVNSFLSQRAFNENPRTRNTVATIKSAIVADISLKTNEIIIGITIKIPDI